MSKLYEDIENFYEDPDNIANNIKDLFKLTLINKQKNVVTSLRLENEDEDEIDITETLSSLTKFTKEKMKGSDNQVVNQILPLVSQVLSDTLVDIAGPEAALFFLTDETIKMTLVYSMVTIVLFMKFLDQNNFNAVFLETPISKEKVKEIIEMNAASNILTKAAFLGQGDDLIKILKTALDNGNLSQEKFDDMISQIIKDEDSD